MALCDIYLKASYQLSFSESSEYHSFMHVLLIKGFPLPPSENILYRNVPRVGRVATKELKQYREECKIWEYQNKAAAETFKNMCFKHWSNTSMFQFDYFFIMKKERIFTKDGRPKRLDVANRIKAMQDSLCNILGLDDKHIFSSYIEKLVGEKECVHIEIKPHSLNSAVELENSLNGVERLPDQ